MSKRDVIEEIRTIKQRLPNPQNFDGFFVYPKKESKRWKSVKDRFTNLGLLYNLMELFEDPTFRINVEEYIIHNSPQSIGLLNLGSIMYENARYLPIGLVACMEGYFRLVYTDLINFGEPYRSNVAKFDKEIKFGLETAISLQSNSISIGEFIAHLLPCNNLSDINTNMSTLIGDDFLKLFKINRPNAINIRQLRLFEEDEDANTARIIDILKGVFELRHMFCHEIDPQVTDEQLLDMYPGLIACSQFMFTTETIVENLIGEN